MQEMSPYKIFANNSRNTTAKMCILGISKMVQLYQYQHMYVDRLFFYNYTEFFVRVALPHNKIEYLFLNRGEVCRGTNLGMHGHMVLLT